jgi:predicted phage terminase large subunit-like protein
MPNLQLAGSDIESLKAQVRNEMSKRSLYEWVKLSNQGYKDNTFGKDLCDRVQSFLLDDNTKGAYQILIISSPPQHGKACEDSTPVLTTKGWKIHGDLVVGDYVYGVDGFPKLITHTQTSYLHDCVEVTLDSGDRFICAKEHEWVVECNRDRIVNGKRGQRQTEILEAQHIFDGYHAKSPAIKLTMPLQNEFMDLPIDPYLLGLWLGDGYSAGVPITSHIDDFEEIAERLIKRGHIVKIRNDSSNNKVICVGVTNRKRGSNYFLNGLKGNNLIQNKHIPPMYINASYEQRVELLKGLMDTDGSVTKDGCICEYSGINKTLVLQVYELVRSLGIKCSFRTGDAKLNGRVISKCYKVQFTPNKEQSIFGLARKQNRINTKTKTDRNDKNLFFIKSIKECGQHRVKCITVDGGIYLVGNGFVPTHNSTNITESVPAWFKGRNPNAPVIILSYNDIFAQKFGTANMRKLKEFGKQVFGVEVEEKEETCTPFNFSLKGHKGQIISRGLMAGVTGNPATLVVLDDPIKNEEEADSEVYRNKVWSGYLANIKTRMAANGKVILIMTRWHEDDLAGRIQAIEDIGGNVTVLHYPCECDEPETDLLHRQRGDSLSPELGKDKNWVHNMKMSYLNDPTQKGRRVWDAMFQGRPSALEGNIMQATWFRFWKPKGVTLPPVKIQLADGEVMQVDAVEIPEYLDKEIQSWDCTFKKTNTSDFVAGGVFGRRKADVFLVDAIHKRLDFTETIANIELLTRKYPKAVGKLVEDKANGSAVISSMQRVVSGLIPVQANDDKVARFRAVTPVIQSGNFFLPHPKVAPWVNELMKELLDFPNGKNDDYVDMVSQALNYLMYETTDTLKDNLPTGLWAYPKLHEMGFKDYDIKRAWKDGRIRLLLIPPGWKR